MFPIVSMLLASIFMAGCDEGCPGDNRPRRNADEVTIAQGMWGDVWFFEGDFMPTCPQGHVRAVSREVVVFELAMPDDATPGAAPGFYSEIHTQELARTTSDRAGFFQVELPPGDYSVFVVENDEFYTCYFGNGMSLAPVSVTSGEVSDVRLDITYLSTW
jgi:hypothetical protein